LIAKEGTKIPVDIIGSTIKDDRGGIIVLHLFSTILSNARGSKRKKAHPDRGTMGDFKLGIKELDNAIDV